MSSKNNVSTGYSGSLFQLCGCLGVVPNPQGVVSTARNDLVSCFVQFYGSNSTGMASELLNDGARIEIALNLLKVSINHTDHETILVFWRLCKRVNIVNGGVSSKSDLFFHLVAKSVSLNKLLVSDDRLNSPW